MIGPNALIIESGSLGRIIRAERLGGARGWLVSKQLLQPGDGWLPHWAPESSIRLASVGVTVCPRPRQPCTCNCWCGLVHLTADELRLLPPADEPAARPAPRHRRADPRRAPLGDRQLEVLRLIAEGLTNEQIAEKLWLGLDTVRTHVSKILVSLDAANRAHAVAVGFHRRLLVVDPPDPMPDEVA